MTVKNIFSKKMLWVATLGFFLVSTFAATFLGAVPKASASGELYEWTGNTTIHVSRGDLKSPENLGSSSGNGSYFGGGFRLKSGCALQIAVTVASDNFSGKETAQQEQVAGGSGSFKCTSSEIQSFNRTVIINGTRPGFNGDETAAQKGVQITIQVPQKASDVAEKTLTVAITQNGKSIQSVTANRDPSPSDNPDDVTFTANTTLDPGTYHFCSSKYSGCTDQTKVKYLALAFTMGSTFSQGTVTGQIQMTLTNQPVCSEINFAPVPMVIEKPDGTVVYRASTATFDRKPTDAELQACGNANANRDITLSGDFTGVAPGDYKFCVPSINACTNFSTVVNGPTTVTIKANSDQANKLAGTTSNQQAPTCENSSKDPLTWIICPVFNALTSMSDWLLNNLIQPLLAVNPVTLDASSGEFKIWSNFRVYGDVLLVIALLVLVIGQSIGAGFFDAYTVKKMLPRILLCAILINVSIYIVAFAIDLSNVVGAGIGQVIIAPVRDSAQFTFTPSGIQVAGIAVGSAGALIGTFLTGILFSGAVTQAALYIGLFVVMPAILSLIGAFITIILRQGLILALVLVSPVAFALYVFPNTEKYFRQWWDWLFKALLVYPIIMAIFAIADVMTVMIQNANSLGTKPLLSSVSTGVGGAVASGGSKVLTNIVAGVVAFVVQFLPLVMIPFAFRIAGGLVGRAHDLLHGYGKKTAEGIKGNPNDENSLRNRTRYNMRSRALAGRTQRYGQLKNAEVNGRNAFTRGLAGFAARRINFGDIEGQRAKYNAEQEKIIAAQYSSGGDDSIRALWARRGSNGRWYSYSPGPDGKYKEWAGADVAKARSMAARDPSRLGAIGKYEMGKAAEDGNLDDFKQRYSEMTNEMGWSNEQANEVWAGMKFSHQNTRLEQKHTAVAGEKGNNHFNNHRTSTVTGNQLSYGDVNHGTFSTELADKVRNFDFANFRPSTAKAATEGYREAKAAVDRGDLGRGGVNQKIVENYESVARGLDARRRSGLPFHGEGDNVPQQGYPGGATTGGSARADEAWTEFIDTVNGSNGGGGNTPPPAVPTPSGGGPIPGVPGSGGGTVRPSGLWTPGP